MDKELRSFIVFIVIFLMAIFVVWFMFPSNNNISVITGEAITEEENPLPKTPQNINAVQQNGNYPIRADGKNWNIIISAYNDLDYSSPSGVKTFSDNRDNQDYRIYITWDAVSGATSYQIRISNEEDGQRYYWTTETNSTYFTLQGLTYYTWYKKDISYQVDDACFSLTHDLIDKAFADISASIDNILKFKKVEANGDINIICHSSKYNNSPWAEFDTLGLSKNNYTNTGLNIESSEINLYGAVSLITIEHEILHSLGISQHSALGESVMSPYEDIGVGSVSQHLDEETISTLKGMYNYNS